MTFCLKKISFFAPFLGVLLLICACTPRSPLDAWAWIPAGAVAVSVVGKNYPTDSSVVEPWVRHWAKELRLTEAALVRCRVSATGYGWLVLGKSSQPTEINPAVVANSWTYKGVPVFQLQTGDSPVIYAGKWMGVFFLAPHLTLIEEVIEKRFSLSGKWKKARRFSGEPTTNRLFWDSSYPSFDWIPEATGASGILSTSAARVDSNLFWFHFSPYEMPKNQPQVHFPYGMVALIPEDTRTFLFPYYPATLQKGTALAAGMERPFPLRIQVYSGENEQLSSLLLFRTSWGVKQRTAYYSQQKGAVLTYRSFRFVQLEDAALAALKPTLGVESPWVLEVEGMLLVAGTPTLLERWVDYYQSGATMTRRLAPWFPSPDVRALFWAYGTLPNQLPNWMANRLPFGCRMLNSLVAHKSEWKLRLQVLPEPDSEAATALVWRQTLSSEVIRFFSLPGHPGVAVQTTDFQVFFLDREEGTIRFRFNPGKPILGDIYATKELDELSPGWLMQTSDAVYKLDNQGHLFPGFPIRLRVPAAAPLTFKPGFGGVGGTFFYPSQNGRIYGYQLEGAPLPAWSPSPFIDGLVGRLQLFEEAGKDYISGLSRVHGLFALDVAAQAHFSPVSLPVAEGMELHLELNALSKRWVTRSPDGKVWVVSLRGTHFPLPLSKYHASLFRFGQLEGDERADYLMAAPDGTIVLSGYRGDSFEVFWKAKLDFFPDEIRLAKTSIGTYIAAENKKRRTWSLLDGHGKELPGSPVGGSLDIKWSDSRHLITVLDNSVVCWKLPASR